MDNLSLVGVRDPEEEREKASRLGDSRKRRKWHG